MRFYPNIHPKCKNKKRVNSLANRECLHEVAVSLHPKPMVAGGRVLARMEGNRRCHPSSLTITEDTIFINKSFEFIIILIYGNCLYGGRP
jgi:hypothetical protein